MRRKGLTEGFEMDAGWEGGDEEKDGGVEGGDLLGRKEG